MEDLDALLDRFAATRARTVALAAPLAIEDQVVQSMPDASPTKWHLAHTTWFFDTFVLGPAGGGSEGPPAYQRLFNSYYNTVGPPFPRSLRGTISRPTVAEVLAFRERVDRALPTLVRGLPAAERPAAASRVLVGIHHEQQHQELLLTDIKHALGRNPLRPPYDESLASPSADAVGLEMIELAGGVREIGYSGDDYAFDNERPRHEVLLRDYRIGSRLVTNGELEEFVSDGGYERHELWLDDGWTRVRSEGWEAPLYWERREDGWVSYTLGGVRPLDPNAPACHVSYFEADAYARWRGKRLPTEAEWEVAAAEANEGARGTLAEDGALHPVGRPCDGPVRHLVGEVWEHTASAYLPYPGFVPLAGALGEYNGKFMNGQMVLRGASCATPRSHARLTYRNFFQPDKRWQFSGFRLAE